MAPSSSSPTDGKSNGHHAGPAAATSTNCGCPDQCRAFEHLPIDKGLMIMLHVPSEGDVEDTDQADRGASCEDNRVNGAATAKMDECTCLKLCPQEDANLSQFHPNIYIPSVLMNYPEELVRYGGGGEIDGLFI